MLLKHLTENEAAVSLIKRVTLIEFGIVGFLILSTALFFGVVSLSPMVNQTYGVQLFKYVPVCIPFFCMLLCVGILYSSKKIKDGLMLLAYDSTNPTRKKVANVSNAILVALGITVIIGIAAIAVPMDMFTIMDRDSSILLLVLNVSFALCLVISSLSVLMKLFLLRKAYSTLKSL